MKYIAGIFLFCSGLANAMPFFSEFLANITGGIPYIEVAIGLLSILIAVALITAEELAHSA